MRKIKTLLFMAFSLLFINCSNSEEIQEFKVLQLNIWHGTTTVSDGFEGLVSIIEQTDPDIVLLSELREDVIPRLIEALQAGGRTYYGQTVKQSAGMISKHPIDNQQLCCHSNIQGGMTKTHITVAGHTLVLYSAHLDYTHYECYLPRGYSGTTWKKIEAPIVDAESVLRANRLSERDETIASFIEDAGMELSKGNLVILGGDFNEPSHLDWQADTKDLRDHNGVIINWDCSIMLTEMGMKDTYRELYPNAVTHPGFTFPSANKHVEISQLTWAPEADERDRIDFIYYHPDAAWTLKNAQIVGPEETIANGKVKEKDSEDNFIVPTGTWLTDHKGNLATFIIKNKKKS